MIYFSNQVIFTGIQYLLFFFSQKLKRTSFCYFQLWKKNKLKFTIEKRSVFSSIPTIVWLFTCSLLMFIANKRRTRNWNCLNSKSTSLEINGVFKEINTSSLPTKIVASQTWRNIVFTTKWISLESQRGSEFLKRLIRDSYL